MRTAALLGAALPEDDPDLAAAARGCAESLVVVSSRDAPLMDFAAMRRLCLHYAPFYLRYLADLGSLRDDRRQTPMTSRSSAQMSRARKRA